VPADVTAPAKAPSRRTGILAGARNLVLFLLGLGATSAVLSAYVPFPYLGNLWRKYHQIREHGKDYSLIYIGSSRVFHEFIPKQFDAALAQRGHHIRSFNFGQDGMWPPESFYMLREVLKNRPPHLKWVLIDLMGVKSEVDGDEPTKRSVNWHDLRHTLIAWRHALEVDMADQRTFSEKAALCWHHATLWMQKSTSLGRGQERLEIALKLARERKAEKVPDEGFEVGGKGPLTGEMLTMFNSAVAKLKTNLPPKPIEPLLGDALDAVIKEVRAAGAQPIFVVAAGIYGAERFTDWPPAGVRVLRFDDPIQFPDLYDPAHRYDPHHLDAVGAQAFTKRLSDAFAEVLEQKP
jgi:hypothetical protein